MVTCDWSVATAASRAEACAGVGAREAKTPTETAYPKIVNLHRLVCFFGHDPCLIDSAVTLPLTSVVFATHMVARLDNA